MSDENLFSGEVTPTPEDKPNTINLPDNVKDLIGEGKKYSTVEKALEALGHSQAHISKIETENAQLRTVAEKAVDTEKLYETVQELLKAQEGKTPNAAPVDASSIESLLDRKLTEREQRNLENANADTVKQALVTKFGDKETAQKMFDEKAKELGIGVGFLTDLAKKSPKAVLEYFGVKNAGSPAPTRTTVNSEQLSTQHREEPRKTVMGGASSAELLAAWKAAAPKTS